MKKHYGIPYMGSKEKILGLIQYIFDRESNKKYFIDPFCGGFSVSAYALENTKFRVYANDLNEYVIDLYKEILFNHSKELKKVWLDWVDREQFKDVKENPEKYPKWYVGYVLTIWSFGNSQNAYLFGKQNEDIKKRAHEYLIQNGYDGTPNKRIALIKEFKLKEKISGRLQLQRLQQLERLERLQQLERLAGLEQLERLERLQQLKRLTGSEQLERLERLDSKDWLEFINSIPNDVLSQSFIYCDPPYENRAKYYKNSMNYDKFWNWFRNFPYPVYVSSYSTPEDIKPIISAKKEVLLCSAKKRKIATENIYFNGKGNHLFTMYDGLFNQYDNPNS